MAKMKETKTSAINKNNILEEDSIYDKLAFLPMIVILGIVPLIIRLKIQSATGADMSYALGANFADPFSYWKSGIIFIMAIVMVVAGFFLFKKSDIKSSKAMKIGGISLGIFALITLISAIVSPHKSLVWWGQYGLRGGFVTIFSYVIICFYSLHFYKKKADASYILVPLSVMVVVEGIVIFSQFIGNDIIFSDFVKSIIIPSEYGNVGDTMNLGIEGKAYGTLFNPNYIGSFVALLLPIFMFVCFKVSDIKWKVFYGIVAIALIVSLFASGSRAGIIGVSVSVLIGVIVLGKFLIKKSKMVGLGMIIIVVAGIGISTVTGGLVAERIASITKDAMSVFSSSNSDILADSAIKDISIKENRLIIDFGTEQLNLAIDDNYKVVLTDKAGTNIDYARIENVYIVPNATFPIDIRFQEGEITYETTSKKLYMLEVDGSQWFMVTKEDGNLVSLDKYGNPMSIGIAEAIGFAGKEKIGSNRGYIWSRSLPVLRDNLLLGVGPDAFVAAFPHGDIVVRNAVYGYATAIADKPHNLYLQIGINQGIIALLSFLVLNITYIVNSFRVYRKKMEYTFHDMFGIGIMLGIVGYLGAGMFNDSVVSVAPLYWCLLGVGFAVNYINSVDTLQEIDNKKRQG